MMEGYGYPFNLLTEYFIRENNIDLSRKYEIKTISARSLICAERFDLLAKWIYIDAREKGIDSSWAEEIYYDNINAFSCGTFLEPGTDDKNSFLKYKREFENIIEDIKKNGFDKTISLIPVGKDNIILDGAHRVAVAAYYNKNVTVIYFPELTRQYDYRYFRKFLMTDMHMGMMASCYAQIKKNCFMACIWSKADRGLLKDAEEELRKGGHIVYSQDVYLTYQGMRNLMVQIYGHQSWTGNINNQFEGVNLKVDACYRKEYPVRTYLFEADDLNKVLETKKRIRDIFQIGNHSIHISDDCYETQIMLQLLYNSNACEFLNLAEPYKFDYVFRKLFEFKETVKGKGYDSNRFAIDSSAVLEIYGVRRANDIDYLTDYDDCAVDFGKDIDNHQSQLKYYNCTVQEILYNPKNYFYFHEMKFVAIRRVMKMKTNRNESKDVLDVELCKKFLKRRNRIPYKHRYKTYLMINQYQKKFADYGHGMYTLDDYYMHRIKQVSLKFIKPAFKMKYLLKEFVVEICRRNYIILKRKKLKNTDISIIASNCNGGVVSSDLGLRFNSPFVNLFLKADDFVKMLDDLKGYMEEDLCFIQEVDSIYGQTSYPTAYLKDVKIYFMHYKSSEEALEAWNRRKMRINWDNLYVVFTDRSGCTQEILEMFDKLPYKNKVVFTHVPHPEIRSSFYVKGYEKEEKVGILSEYQNGKYSYRRQLDQFDFVNWFNGNIQNLANETNEKTGNRQ